jgi:glycosyltransferase involved in cell wall biosynthesis
MIAFSLCNLLFGSLWCRPEPQFFVVIPSFKCDDYCIENIESVIRQTYPEWTAAVIIDGDPEDDDGAYQRLTQYVAKHGLQQRITVCRNTSRRYSLANIHRAITTQCPSDDHIVVILDGDDYFLHERVLERIAQEYRDPEVWLTYGQYRNMPAGTRGMCRPYPADIIRENRFREYPFIASHPRTFYAWLYKQIRLSDLYCGDWFFRVTGDVAIMLPLLEMASRGHIRCIEEPLYAYRHYENNDYAVRCADLLAKERDIRSRSRYMPLKNRPS